MEDVLPLNSVALETVGEVGIFLVSMDPYKPTVLSTLKPSP